MLHDLSVVELWVDNSLLSLDSGLLVVLLEALVRILQDLVVIVHVQALRLRKVYVLRILLVLAAAPSASLSRRGSVVLSAAHLTTFVSKEVRVLVVFLSLA